MKEIMPSPFAMEIATNRARIEERIEDACRKAGRSRQDVQVIAVSKTVALPSLRAAYEAGVRIFGESRVQEFLPKHSDMPEDTEWHFIGKLQSNKLRKVASKVAAIHTLESISQLKELDKCEHSVPCLIEVNIGEEPQKSGVMPSDLPHFLESVLHSKNVLWLGLMAIGPVFSDPEAMRPYFRRMQELNSRFGGQWLSMGMSHDFDIAIQEGSTHIRVGSALFGSRT